MVAKTSKEIEAQIAKLQRELKLAKAKEVKDLVLRIRGAIAHYGLTIDDLFGSKLARQHRASASGPPRGATVETSKPKERRDGPPAKVAIKFKDDSGNTWTGRGTQPRWLTAAVGDGRSIEEFRISN